MNRHFILSAVAIASLFLFLRLPVVAAAEKSPAELLPSTTVAYVEIAEPTQLLDVLLEHPLRAKFEALEDVKKAMNGPQYKQFLAVVKVVEQQIGMKWREALETLTHDGIILGLDAKTNGLAAIFKSNDENKLTKLRETFLKLARDDAKRKGNPDRIETKEYRGLTAYKIGDGVLAQLGNLLFATNKGDLAKVIADSYLDGNQDCLANKDNFKAARQSIKGKPTAWEYIDVEALRNAGIAKELFREKNDNPAAEFLIGGILSTLAKTPFATLELNVKKENLRLSAAVPHDASWTPARREYFFGPGGKGDAPTTLLPKQTLLTIDVFRDIGRFWLAKEDLFEERITAKLAQADGQFSTLFAGLDFGQDVLAAAKPQIQIVSTRQSYEGTGLPTPDIRIPASAIIFQLKEPEKIQQRFKVAFQSLMGFLNVALAQQGQPQFDVETEKRGNAKIISASYIADERKEGLINYNFSPTIAFVGNRFIISSTSGLAGELVELVEKQSDKPRDDGTTENVRVGLDLKVLGDVLQDNRKQLVAQNILKKGHSKEAAEKEIGTVLDLLGAGKNSALRLLSDAKSLKLELELNFVD